MTRKHSRGERKAHAKTPRLTLMKRGKRLFLAVADPTNLHALDEIRFQTSMSIEFVVVEDTNYKPRH